MLLAEVMTLHRDCTEDRCVYVFGEGGPELPCHVASLEKGLTALAASYDNAIKARNAAEKMRDDAILHFAAVVRAYGYLEFSMQTLVDTDIKRLHRIDRPHVPHVLRFEYR